MGKENKEEVKIGIKSIKEVCFSQTQIEDISIDKKYLQFSFGFSLNAQKDTQTMNVTVGVRYLYKKHIVLECKYLISFHIIGFDQAIKVHDNNKELSANNDLIVTLLNVGFGTLRGIVVVKTAGTLLGDFPMPVVNPAEIAKSATQQTL